MAAAPSISDYRAFQLEADDWHAYFQALATDGDGLVARVISSPGRPPDGRAEDALAWPLHAIRYDADADEIEIHVGHRAPRGAILRYFVSGPRSIHVQERVHGKVIFVQDTRGVRTLIQVANGRAPGALRSGLGPLDQPEI